MDMASAVVIQRRSRRGYSSWALASPTQKQNTPFVKRVKSSESSVIKQWASRVKGVEKIFHLRQQHGARVPVKGRIERGSVMGHTRQSSGVITRLHPEMYYRFSQ